MKLIHIFTIFSTARSFFDGQFKYVVDQGNEIILISSYSPDEADFVKRNNIRFIPVALPRSISPLSIFKALKSITFIIKKEKPDAVFGHTPVGALVAMTAASLCGVKNRVYYRHGLIYTTMTGLKRTVFKMEEKFVSSLATAIINVSHSLSRLAVSEKLNSASKQYVIGHGTCGGIDAQNIFNPDTLDKTKLSEIRSSLDLDYADITYGFCGRICNDKGIPELIDGFNQFCLKHPDINAKLLLVGDMDERDAISDKYRSQIEKNNRIISPGYIAKSEIKYYYALLDVFVFPSHREGFGMVAIEASAMEKPVLVSRSHGCIDSIVEHETGEYIDLTSNGICSGMELMMDSNLRNRLGKTGREKVLEWYDFQVMWKQIANLYNKTLK